MHDKYLKPNNILNLKSHMRRPQMIKVQKLEYKNIKNNSFKSFQNSELTQKNNQKPKNQKSKLCKEASNEKSSEKKL